MAQHDYVIANGTGAAVRSDLNNALAAIVTQNSGSTEPATTYAYQWWADTTTGLLKLRNAANSAWITLFQLDGEWSTIAVENGTAGAPSIYFKDSGTDTGFYSPGANQVGISTGGTAALVIDSSQRVGLGTSSPNKPLHIYTGSSDSEIRLQTNSGTEQNAYITLRNSGGKLDLYSVNGDIALNPGNNVAATFKADGKVGIGTTGPLAVFDCVTGGFGARRLLITEESSVITVKGANTTPDPESLRFVGSDLRFAVGSTTAGTSERGRWDSSGRFLVGTSTSRSDLSGPPLLQIEGANDSGKRYLSLTYGRAGVDGPYIFLAKHRSDSVGGTTVVQANDQLGAVSFYGHDGTDFEEGARIQALVDGTPGNNDIPTRLVFSTTADGASSPTERMRIENSGRVGVGVTASSMSGYPAHLGVFVADVTADQAIAHFAMNNTGSATRSFLLCSSNYTSSRDLEFALLNNGQAYADGSWNGGGADYAEFFEWSDGNPDEEDRRGISVVLDGSQIRPAVDGEDPIGVISGNPSVVGDAAWNKWSGKYLRDDYGTYVLNENGERQLSPAFDPDQKYVKREDRPEWDCVGLMGKLRIRKGQLTGSRWIKMRDISDSVEEWLVR